MKGRWQFEYCERAVRNKLQHVAVQCGFPVLSAESDSYCCLFLRVPRFMLAVRDAVCLPVCLCDLLYRAERACASVGGYHGDRAVAVACRPAPFVSFHRQTTGGQGRRSQGGVSSLRLCEYGGSHLLRRLLC